jgi:CheY-like chemotaxis protein
MEEVECMTAEKKAVLVVEDNPVELENMGGALQNDYYVILSSSIDRANDEIGKLLVAKRHLDLLIIDLNMSNSGLKTVELKRRTHGGSLTGWVWLYNVALKELSGNYPKVLVYSEFIQELEEEMKKDSIDENEKKYYKSIKTITKSETVNDRNVLKKAVDDLLGG